MTEPGLDTTIQVVAVIATVIAFVVILELVRRRRLVERYALLWLLAGAALVVLAVWRDLLEIVGDAIGVADPVNAIFLLAFVVAFGLLLHFSVANSRLSDETKILGQEVARLDQELRAMRRGAANGDGSEPAPDGGETLAEIREGPAANAREASSGPPASSSEAPSEEA
jgi:hypothetical protein